MNDHRDAHAADAALPPAPDDAERLLLHADLDGELDAAASLAVARRCAERPELAAEAERLAALHRALSRLPPAAGPSPALRARLAQPWMQAPAAAPDAGPPGTPAATPPATRAAVPLAASVIPPPAASAASAAADPTVPPAAAPAVAPVVPLPVPRRAGWRSDWRALAASCVLTAGLAFGSAALLFAPDAQQTQIGATVAGHRRALLAQHTVDVASSDRHTVKPWLSSRLALAPNVVDLAAAGYPLLGARIEIVDGQPAPTLVYGHREHLISLSLIPAATATDTAPTPANVDGYAVLRWQHAGMALVAVSDIDRAGLDDFVARYRSAARGSGGEDGR